jgi:hypothetical protein
MGAVYSKGTVDEIAAFETAMETVMNKENAGEIAEFLSSDNFDWSDQEHLIDAKRKLIDQYKLEESEANALVVSIGNATNAVSSLTVLDEVFGDLYKATRKVESALEKVADLQWEYERMLKGGADALAL